MLCIWAMMQICELVRQRQSLKGDLVGSAVHSGTDAAELRVNSMWPYAKRGTRFDGDVFERFPSELRKDRFSTNDAVIKLWLPERLLAALDVLSSVHFVSRPDVVRWVLFEHVFGKVEFALLLERERRKRANEWYDGPVFSRKTVASTARALRVRYLGKSTTDLKVEIPLALKQGLETLAAQAGESLSAYIRRVLARDFLTERQYQEWRRREDA